MATTVERQAGGRLYECAAPAARDALWHLDAGRTLFIGPLDYNASHQHGAPVYLAGLYGRFGLRVEGGRWRQVRTAVIPAGVRHEHDFRRTFGAPASRSLGTVRGAAIR